MRRLLLASSLAFVGACLLAPAWVALALGGIVALEVAAGIVIPATGLFARPFLQGPRGLGRVALTFDDGPDPVGTPAILDLLEQRGHRGTFFLIGQRAERHAALARELVRRGHAVANHSFHHSWATPLWSPARIGAELLRAQTAIEEASGVRPTWFRPPIGLFSPRIAPGAARAGLALCAWSLRAYDGVPWRARAGRIASRIRRRLRDGDVVLLHDAGKQGRAPVALEVLPAVLELLDARGWRSVTLDELASSPTPTADAVANAAHRRGR